MVAEFAADATLYDRFCRPIIIVVLSGILGYEELTPFKLGCVLLGFAGVLVALYPSLSGGGDLTGYIATIFCTICFSVLMTTIRAVSQTETVSCIQLVNFGALAVFGISGTFLSPAPLPDIHMLGFALLAGLFFCTSNILFNMALKHTIASNVMPFHYTMIVWGALYTY